MGKPRRWRVALVLRIQFFDGDTVKPKRNISIPIPLLFLLAFALDVFVYVSVHAASIVLPAFGQKRWRKSLERPLPLLRAITRIFFLTRLSFGVMRYGNALELRAVGGASGIVVSVD